MNIRTTIDSDGDYRNRQRLRAEEALIREATQALCDIMAHEGVSQAELARRLGQTRAHVFQLLAGGRNFTLRTIADIADALGYRAHITLYKEQS